MHYQQKQQKIFSNFVKKYFAKNQENPCKCGEDSVY